MNTRERKLVYHGGVLHPEAGIWFFSDNRLVAEFYARQDGIMWSGVLSLAGAELVVFDLKGGHTVDQWSSHAAHCNAQPETGVLVVKNVHDHGVGDPNGDRAFPAELLSTVYSTRELWRFRPTRAPWSVLSTNADVVDTTQTQ